MESQIWGQAVGRVFCKLGSVPVLEERGSKGKRRHAKLSPGVPLAVPGTCCGGPDTLTSLLSGCEQPVFIEGR